MPREQRPRPARRGLLLFLLGGLLGANATYFLMARHASPVATVAGDVARSATPPAPAAQPLPGSDGDTAQHQAEPRLPPPVASMRGTPPGLGATSPSSTLPVSSSGLLIPVQGVTAANLSDTFTDARSAGRSHDAIDIMAAGGTPVLAAADGHVEKFFNSKLGGLTIYEFNTDGTLAYYYAHLQRYAEGLAEQQGVTRGQVIGYVGSTGNANPEAPHLHFAIFKLGPEKQWWKGEAINPYPELGGTPR